MSNQVRITLKESWLMEIRMRLVGRNKEHGKFFEHNGIGRLIDMQNVGKNRLNVLAELLVKIPVNIPSDLTQKESIKDSFVHIQHHLFDGSFKKTLERVF